MPSWSSSLEVSKAPRIVDEDIDTCAAPAQRFGKPCASALLAQIVRDRNHFRSGLAR